MDKMEELRIVLLGKTGAGKSSVGNAIVGEEVFTGACSVKSTTQICERAERVINGKRIVVIDTPGIFDTDRSEEELKHEIISSLVECAPGPHVFILVLKIERHTEENQKALEKLVEYFSESIFPHMILLFTHGDDLDENTEIEHFLNQPKCNLEDVTKKSGDRVHVVDNKHWNENSNDSALIDRLKQLNFTKQAIRELTEKMKSAPAEQTPWFNVLSEQSDSVETEYQNVSDEQRMKEYRTNRYQLTQLMKSVKNILRENKGQHYSNETLEETEKAINVEVENIMHETEHEGETVDTVEIRRRARERLRTKLGEKLVGVAVGILLGAFLGVGVGVAAPAVIMAGLIRGVWRALNDPRPQGEDASANAEAGCSNLEKLTVGTALSLAGTVTMGVATGLGAALGAGGGVLFGPTLGGAFGYEEAKMAPNSKQTAKQVSQTVLSNAKEFLKECWNLGNIDPGEECKTLIDKNNKKQE